MKKTLFVIVLLVLQTLPGFADELGVGSDSQAAITVPEAFHHEEESASTLFVMPRENDPDGPISLRLSCLKDLSDSGLSEAQVGDLLKHLNPNSELLHYGANLATTQTEEGLDDQGLKWRFTHYAVCAGQLLITVTVQTIESRDKEPQCHELLEAMPRILASLRRKGR